MSRIRWPDNVEAKRVAPGHWLVEGRTIRRATSRRWHIYYDGLWIGTCPTLTAAVEWIVSEDPR